MMKAFLPFCLSLVLGLPSIAFRALAADANPWKIPSAKKDFHVFLLMGQSNMSGYGKLLPEDTQAVPFVLKLPTKGALEWTAAAHPLHNRLGSDRFGLGLPFAKGYLDTHPNSVVGLIPLAWGGAAIDRLDKGSPTYADAIRKATYAKTQGVIKGVLWHQGESDTVHATKADGYEKKLHQLIHDLREDLGDETLPFIVGNLAEFYGTGKAHNQPERVARIDQVRKALRTLPEKVAHTGFAASTGCTSPDQHLVHFDRASYIKLGKRYADAYAKVAVPVRADPGSTRVSARIKIPATLPSFAGRTLELRLYEFDPRLADVGANLVDLAKRSAFSHTQGKVSEHTIVLGAKGRIKAKRSYYLTCFVLDDKKRTHMGEKDGRSGLCKVLTSGHPREVDILFRPVR
jgi:hypothetical protein